jgi:hypothetical protein
MLVPIPVKCHSGSFTFHDSVKAPEADSLTLSIDIRTLSWTVRPKFFDIFLDISILR